MNDCNRSRCLVEMQGYTGLTAEEAARVDVAARFAPAVCLAWVAVAAGLRSPLLVALLIPFAVAGAALPYHPFDLVYNALARRWGGSPLPRHGAPRRWACALASLLLAATVVALATGHALFGMALMTTMIVLPLVVVTTGFCVPSFLYRLFGFGRSRNVADTRPRACLK